MSVMIVMLHPGNIVLTRKKRWATGVACTRTHTPTFIAELQAMCHFFLFQFGFFERQKLPPMQNGDDFGTWNDLGNLGEQQAEADAGEAEQTEADKLDDETTKDANDVSTEIDRGADTWF